MAIEIYLLARYDKIVEFSHRFASLLSTPVLRSFCDHFDRSGMSRDAVCCPPPLSQAFHEVMFSMMLTTKVEWKACAVVFHNHQRLALEQEHFDDFRTSTILESEMQGRFSFLIFFAHCTGVFTYQVFNKFHIKIVWHSEMEWQAAVIVFCFNDGAFFVPKTRIVINVDALSTEMIKLNDFCRKAFFPVNFIINKESM